MKKLFTILFLFVFIISAKAQPYQTMFPEGRKWVDLVSSPFGGSYASSYRIEKDTTINGLAYKKIQDYSTAFLREDLDSGKVWVLTSGSAPSEILYMDYNLVKGDTFSQLRERYTTLPDSAIIVDTVYVKDSRKHIAFKFEGYPNEPFEFIEGIGSNCGFLYFSGLMSPHNYLLCVEDNGIQTFSNKYFNGNCYPTGFPSAVNDIAKTNKIDIYPNPANDILNISFLSNLQETTNYSIVDIAGREIMTGIFTPEQRNCRLDVLQLPSGLYFLNLQNANINEHIRFLKQ